MAGRRHIFMLLGLTVCCPATVFGYQIQPSAPLIELASRCRDTAGEQAASDVINLAHSLPICIDLENLYAEAQQYMTNGDVKGLLEAMCQKKEDFLTCGRQGLETVKRCLLPKEMEFAETAERALEVTGDFVCENIDDLAKIAEPQEIGCAQHVGGKAETCAMQVLESNYGSQYSTALEKLLESKEELCRINKETLQCLDDPNDKCKDSVTLRLVKSYYKKMMDRQCSDIGTKSGVSDMLGFAAILPFVLGHLFLGLAAQHLVNCL